MKENHETHDNASCDEEDAAFSPSTRLLLMEYWSALESHLWSFDFIVLVYRYKVISSVWCPLMDWAVYFCKQCVCVRVRWCLDQGEVCTVSWTRTAVLHQRLPVKQQRPRSGSVSVPCQSSSLWTQLFLNYIGTRLWAKEDWLYK